MNALAITPTLLCKETCFSIYFSTGILVAKKKLFENPVPSGCDGGSVFFVCTLHNILYCKNLESNYSIGKGGRSCKRLSKELKKVVITRAGCLQEWALLSNQNHKYLSAQVSGIC
mgnify:CR=1 FL=1